MHCPQHWRSANRAATSSFYNQPDPSPQICGDPGIGPARIPTFSNIARRQVFRYVTEIGPVSGQGYLVDQAFGRAQEHPEKSPSTLPVLPGALPRDRYPTKKGLGDEPKPLFLLVGRLGFEPRTKGL